MRKKIWGVYMIQSKIKPERIYIGSFNDVIARWRTHVYELKTKTHHSIKLQRHYDKYGENDLIYEMIECGEYFNRTHLYAREQIWCDRFIYKQADTPYFNNLTNAGSSIGMKASPETRRKMSKSQKGKKKNWSPEKRREAGERLSNQRRGTKLSEEHKQKISKALKGRKQTEEQRQKSALGLKKHWAEHPRKPIPIEERKKHGRPISEERKAKTREWWAKRKAEGWVANKKSQYRERDEFGRFKKKS